LQTLFFLREDLMANLQDHINSAKRNGNIEFFIEERNADSVISQKKHGCQAYTVDNNAISITDF